MESDRASLVFADQQQLGWRAFDQLRKGSQIHSHHENGDRAVLQGVLGHDILQNKMATHARTEGVDQSGSASRLAKVQLYDQATRLIWGNHEHRMSMELLNYFQICAR